MNTEPIKIEGLAQFSRALRKIDNEAPKALRVINNQAAEIVLNTALPWVPHKTGRARASMVLRSTRTDARITEGGNKAPHMPWLDFGGRVGIRKTVERPFRKTGRFIYVAYDAKREAVSDVIYRGLARLIVESGLEVE